MEIRFQSKEESNKRQLEDFLKLSGGERVYSFFKLSYLMKKFPVKNKSEEKSNFIIEIPVKQ